MRVWLVVHAVVLVGLSAWILEPGIAAPDPPDQTGQPSRPQPEAATPASDATPAGADPAGTPTSRPITREEVLAVEGLRFGLSAPDAPWSGDEVARLADAAGAAPTLIQFFTHWTEGYPKETVELSYERGAVPVLSWEPWAGLAHGTSQPEYALARIAGGDFDTYLTAFAEALRDHGLPVVIRFAHEMNGDWYPWSEQNSGNQLGEFVPAWQHVHDLFAEVGADNAIWLWSPNILRPVPEISLAALYPGDDYVDWVGMVGYAVEEYTAAAVFDPTRAALREFTDRPLVITETGAEPGPHQLPWIEDFFGWLAEYPDIIGFIWFEYSQEQGGNADWRFTATLDVLTAFREGIARSPLAPAVPAEVPLTDAPPGVAPVAGESVPVY